MLKEYADIFRRALIVLDCLLLVAAFFLAYYLRKYLLIESFPTDLYTLRIYMWILPTVTVLWGIFLYSQGMYGSLRLKKFREVLWIVIRSAFLSFISFCAVTYAFKTESISRSFIALMFILGVILLVVEKLALVFFLRRLRSSGFNFRNILVVGTGHRAQRFVRYLSHHRELGLNVVGFVDEDPAQVGMSIQGYWVLGTLEQIQKVLRTYIIDEVIFIVPRSFLSKIESAIVYCELVGVTASVAVDLFDLKSTMGEETNLLGIPMISFETVPHNMTALAMKRLLDIVISTAALILISPLYLGVAAAIKLTSAGPVYFTQERCGMNGRKFKLYKFRTMVQDAESRLKDLLARNEMSGPVFKMENDPRVTKIGKFLRKFSLDELPQLWNVFLGDMSLVGPRPPLPSEVRQYDPWHQRRLSIRPGITCIWQAGGRNRIKNFDQWVKMDLEYIDHWSLSLDFKILLKTVPAVLSGAGAK